MKIRAAFAQWEDEIPSITFVEGIDDESEAYDGLAGFYAEVKKRTVPATAVRELIIEIPDEAVEALFAEKTVKAVVHPSSDREGDTSD